jgi:hypothetical protein
MWKSGPKRPTGSPASNATRSCIPCTYPGIPVTHNKAGAPRCGKGPDGATMSLDSCVAPPDISRRRAPFKQGATDASSWRAHPSWLSPDSSQIFACACATTAESRRGRNCSLCIHVPAAAAAGY